MQSQQPYWMMLTAFCISVSLAAIQIVKVLWRPTLEIRLTKETFFRVTEYGESLFANAVVMARRGHVEIRNVSFKLHRSSGSAKTYKLEPLYFGEKTKSDGKTMAEHYFHSQSPIQLVCQDTAKGIVYLAALSEYRTAIAGEFHKFSSIVNKLGSEIQARGGTIADDEMRQIVTKVADLQRNSTQIILNAVQLESGSYNLALEITYKTLGIHRLLPARVVTSDITFNIENDVRTSLQWMTEQALNRFAWNAILGQNIAIVYPQVMPTNISEK